MRIHIEQVLGNTGCLFAGGNCIPFYQLENKRWLLIDSGSHHIRQELTDYLKQEQIQIRAVLCSHAHFDHTENNRFLQETFGAEIVMSAADAGMVRDTIGLKACFYSYSPGDIQESYGEMICRADRIFAPWEKVVEVEHAVFQILQLPGHASSHLGFVTPDGVAYLADAVFSPDNSGKDRLLYMLNWKRALETIEEIRHYDGYARYILAHCGVYKDIRDVAEENISRFLRILEGCLALFTTEGCSLDALITRAAYHYHFPLHDFEWVSLFERLVRAMAEYWVEKGNVKREFLNGVVVYALSDKLE